MKTLTIRKAVFLSAAVVLFGSIILAAAVKFYSNDVGKELVVINNHAFYVDIADNSKERAAGLMSVDNLGQDRGMLFIYSKEDYREFWMKDVNIPLDIIFIDEDKKIVYIVNNAQPCSDTSCSTIKCPKRAKYVLEINAGLSLLYEFKYSDLVEFSILD